MQSDQGDIRQLTIEGGEVQHPPPRPRVTCPSCRKMVTLTERGELHQHKYDKWSGPCEWSGRRYER